MSLYDKVRLSLLFIIELVLIIKIHEESMPINS